MPPKKADQPKKKKATVDDKTFGMKNKKGGSAKRQIAQLNAQAATNQTAEAKRKQAEKDRRDAEKKASEQARKEAMELFKPVQIQKVPFGVDPKTVLCVFFKQGNCEKGRKCKFSHDPNVERKAAKKDLYTDSRDVKAEEEEAKKKDTIDQWDEETLRKVILSKHGNPRTTTDKVCKYFIEAVENQKYGWFWVCPNGGDKCMYKHSLPPGFVLKTKEQKMAEKALMDKSPLNTLTLEDWLESERHKLTGNLTPVTPESFATWKKGRLDKKAAEEQAQKAKEATGRTLFESGNWRDEDESSEEEDGAADDDMWNLEAMRRETERIREEKEAERFAKLNGAPVPASNDETIAQEGEG
ncbi:translation machinery-associated protein 46 [Aspergillus heteromorphus CBS 117.55]|uniref:Translation machinery-associated protein 46 n=1 Tax=Aspergillus heteromorphus CBS 117.55 TaxID=1448321 RepID=A0A317UVD8_9EURO|nr:translation machinery-associated protein 46 [Aspergillus heteromorphus CBS 117.55]PWY65595.1 translation machinery-associated protein 46 [Aspergillus heteromorphus CBS 117.55]